jgi:hypothetical protein
MRAHRASEEKAKPLQPASLVHTVAVLEKPYRLRSGLPVGGLTTLGSDARDQLLLVAGVLH